MDACSVNLCDVAMNVARMFLDGIPVSKYFRTEGETF